MKDAAITADAIEEHPPASSSHGTTKTRRASNQPQPTSPGMTTSTTATLRIFAFKEFAEDPNESLRRHVALHFTYDDGSPHTIYHITGSAYNWKFERRPNYDPTTSDKDVRTYTVGRLEQPTSDAEIEKMLEEVKIDNDNVEKNCQHWVGDALMQLGKCDMLNEDRLDDALDGLADLVVDWDGAEDERSDSVVKDVNEGV